MNNNLLDFFDIGNLVRKIKRKDYIEYWDINTGSIVFIYDKNNLISTNSFQHKLFDNATEVDVDVLAKVMILPKGMPTVDMGGYNYTFEYILNGSITKIEKEGRGGVIRITHFFDIINPPIIEIISAYHVNKVIEKMIFTDDNFNKIKKMLVKYGYYL